MQTMRERVLVNIRRSAASRQYRGVNPLIVEGRNKGCRWIEATETYMRDIGDAHQIIRLRHTGYYTDSFHEAVVVGAVFQLPARRGVTQYVPAVRDPHNKGAALADFSNLTESKEDAARAADSMAERYAEDERDTDARYQAEQQIEDAKESISTARAQHSALAKELREATRAQFDMLRPDFTPSMEIYEKRRPAICKAITDKLKSLRDIVHDEVRRIRRLRNDYWLAVEG